MKKEVRDCTTCKYAIWEMTKHKPPRINKNFAGRCFHTLVIDDFADFVSAATLKTYKQWIFNFNRPKYINLDDLPKTDCRVWESNEKKANP